MPILDPDWQDKPFFRIGETVKVLPGAKYAGVIGKVLGFTKEGGVAHGRMMYRLEVIWPQGFMGGLTMYEHELEQNYEPNPILDPDWEESGKKPPRYKAGDRVVLKDIILVTDEGEISLGSEGEVMGSLRGIRKSVPGHLYFVRFDGTSVDSEVMESHLDPAYEENPIIQEEWYEPDDPDRPKYKIGDRVYVKPYDMFGTVREIRESRHPKRSFYGKHMYRVESPVDLAWWPESVLEPSDEDDPLWGSSSTNPILDPEWKEPKEPQFKIGDVVKIRSNTTWAPSNAGERGIVTKVEEHKGDNWGQFWVLWLRIPRERNEVAVPEHEAFLDDPTAQKEEDV
jgi:hypothetical protein